MTEQDLFNMLDWMVGMGIIDYKLYMELLEKSLPYVE